MDLAEYEEYLRRVDRADSIKELHRITGQARQAHPKDPHAAVIDRRCWDRAQELIAEGRRLERGDWRARAAGG